MIKKLFLTALVLVAFSCEKNDTLEFNDETSKELPIVYVDFQGNTSSRLQTLNGSTSTLSGEYYLAGLDSNCDLSSFGFDNFTTNVNFWDTDIFTPSPLNWQNPNDYGEFPSEYLTRGITAIFNYNDNFLPVVYPQWPDINPVTGEVYYQTVINNYYDEYYFRDSAIGYDIFNGDPIYQYLSYDPISPSVSNELRDLLACKIIDIAQEVDITASIVDIAIIPTFIDMSLNGQDLVLVVYIKWRYDR